MHTNYEQTCLHICFFASESGMYYLFLNFVIARVYDLSILKYFSAFQFQFISHIKFAL